MSNFLRGLVQRGAGLSLPIAIRPTGGPQQQVASVWAALDAHEENSEAAAAASLPGDESLSARATPKPDFAERNDSTPQQVTAILPERRSTAPLPPPIWRAVPRAPTAPEASADASHLGPRQISGNTEAQDPVAVTRTFSDAGEKEPAMPTRSLREGRPAAKPSQSQSETGAMVREAEANSLAVRVAPKQEHFPVVQVPQPARLTTPITEKRAMVEQRSIQVKIGRVEIRSSQPPAVAKTTRPRSSSGFDNWRLARTYLDRTLR